MTAETGERHAQRGRPSCAISDLTKQMMEYLRELLADGPMTSNEVHARIARRFGEGALTNLKRTRLRLGVKRIRHGFGRGGHWAMELPPTPQQRRCSSKEIR